jgi:hypothetical protein
MRGWKTFLRPGAKFLQKVAYQCEVVPGDLYAVGHSEVFAVGYFYTAFQFSACM